MEKKVNIEMVVMKISRSKNLHDEETPWVTGSDYETMLRNKKREVQLPVGRKMPARNSTDIASQTINNEQTTVIVGDSIIQNVQGIKLAKTVGHRVVVKPFPGEPQFATCVRMLFLQLISLQIKFVYMWVPTS